MKLPFFPKINAISNKFAELFPKILSEFKENETFRQFIIKANENYAPWERFSNLPLPITTFSHEELWLFLKMFVRIQKPISALRDKNGQAFGYVTTDSINRKLHQIDMKLADNIVLKGSTLEKNQENDWINKRLVSSFIHEAIASSQIEGAATTRRIAEEMIKSGRKPKNKDEIMIINNYKTITLIKDKWIEKEASIDLLLEIHRVLTKDTMEKESDIGQIRQDIDEKDKINVYDDDGAILHSPPKAEEITKRLQNLCNFINTNETETEFVHPILKAMILHFAIGYIHPFYDGNGRTARALFYWYLIKQGYKLFQYISISEAILKSPGQYKKAYLYTENDGNDLTYFFYYHLKIIEQCIEDLNRYLTIKFNELDSIKHKLRNIQGLNLRQFDLLNHALKNRDERYSYKSHQNLNKISWATARSDLDELSRRNYLEKRKIGKEYSFFVPRDFSERLLS